MINTYLPVIKTWEDPHFVTLTVKAQPARNLNKWVGGMIRAFKLITDAEKKRYQRGKGIRLIGVKSLECNFNPVARTYNPHFHLIVANAEIADYLIVAWQRKWNGGAKKLTSAWAQHKRRVVNLEKDLIEVVKYGSKIFTEPDMDKKAKGKIPPMVYAAALDNIFCTMQGHRLFDRFGFNLPKGRAKEKSEAKFLDRYEEWLFDAAVNDWLNLDTGELLTGYNPPPQLKFIISSSINTDLT